MSRNRTFGLILLSTIASSSCASSNVQPPPPTIPPPPPRHEAVSQTQLLDPETPLPPPPRMDNREGGNKKEEACLDESFDRNRSTGVQATPLHETNNANEDEDDSTSSRASTQNSIPDPVGFSNSEVPSEPMSTDGSSNKELDNTAVELPTTTTPDLQTPRVDAATQTEQNPTHPRHFSSTRPPPPPGRPHERYTTPLQRDSRTQYPQRVPTQPNPRSDYSHYIHEPPPRIYDDYNQFQMPHQHQQWSGHSPYPQQRRPQPRPKQRIRQETPQQKPSTWKSLWKTIERGLDGLADVEDAVSGRAQQLYSTTVKRSKSKKPDRPPPIEQMDWSRFHRSQATKPLERINPQGAKPAPSNNDPRRPPPQRQTGPSAFQKRITQSGGPMGPTKPVATRSKPPQQLRTPNWTDARRTAVQIPGNGGASIPSQEETEQGRIPSQFRQPPIPVETSSPAPPRRKFPDEDEDEDISFLGRVAGAIPRLPRFSSWFGRSGELDNAALAAWKAEDEESVQQKRRRVFRLFPRKVTGPPVVPNEPRKDREGLAAPIQALAERVEQQNNSGLLRPEEVLRCKAIGRSKAFFDILFLAFLMAGIHQLSLVHELITIRGPFWVIIKELFNRMDSIVVATIDTWAPMALICAFLATRTSLLIGLRKERAFKAEVEGSVQSQSQYGSLFLRLTSGATVERDAPDKMIRATRSKIEAKVGAARLRAFSIGLVLPIIAASLAFLDPILSEILSVFRLVWGIGSSTQTAGIVDTIKDATLGFSVNAQSAFANAFSTLLANPLEIAYKASLVVAILLVALLPQVLIRSSKTMTLNSEDKSEDDADDEMYYKFTEHIHDYGSSGINRLNLDAAGLQTGLLERWNVFSSSKSQSALAPRSLRSALRSSLVCCLSFIFLAAPLTFFFVGGGVHEGQSTLFVPRWHSILDVGCVLALTQYLAWDAIARSSLSSRLEGRVSSFISLLKKAIEAKRTSAERSTVPVGFRGSMSSSAGIHVNDLWASHTSKRAWALRGATLSCKNGEVLAILGEDGSAKTRLLVAIAESILSPSTGALSLQRARGSITIGGLEVSKWDTEQLRKRVGILLNDVNSLGATAHLLSGLSLEEILDPRLGAGVHDLNNSPGQKERNVMMMALKTSGLFSTLLRRLPSKMDTIVTSIEEDLSHSPLRPRHHMLSPSEWSKLLFAKVLAQNLYDNENPSTRSSQVIQNSLVGSVLIMDDLTAHLSEAEETRVLKDLRDSGAATLLTSNRWATGRLADRIAVMKDGVVVETGSHTELLLRGPKYSIYAAKWQAMAGSSM